MLWALEDCVHTLPLIKTTFIQPTESYTVIFLPYVKCMLKVYFRVIWYEDIFNVRCPTKYEVSVYPKCCSSMNFTAGIGISVPLPLFEGERFKRFAIAGISL